MSMVGKTFKQKMAAFLAVCMVASSVPTGTVFAAENTPEKDTDGNAASLVEFDVSKLREAVNETVEGEFVTSPTIIASASNAELPENFNTNLVYELADAEKLLLEGTTLPKDTEIRIFLEPENLEEDEDYTLTGSENLTFMIENQGDEIQAYQLVFGNKATTIIEVKSKDQLWEEYEIAAEEEAEGTTETASPSNANSIEETLPMEGEVDPINEMTEASHEEESSSQTVEESSSLTEQEEENNIETTAEETESAEETETEIETTISETEETVEKIEEKREPIIIENNGEETEEERNEEDSSDVTLGSVLNLLTGTIVAYGEEIKVASESNAEPPEETQETVKEELTTEEKKSTETIPQTDASALPAETVQEKETATPSDAERNENIFEEKTFESILQGYELLDATISTSILIEKNSISAKEARELDFGPAMYRTARAAVNTLSTDVEEDDNVEVVKKAKAGAAALVTLNVNAIVPMNETVADPSNFNVTLYDYNGEQYGGNADAINNYLRGQNLYYLDNGQRRYFQFNPSDNSNSNQINRYETEAWYNREWNWNKFDYDYYYYTQNIYQGIPDKFGYDKFFGTVFPENAVGNDEAIKVYSDVSAELFQIDEDGYYYYDSRNSIARYQEDGKKLASTPVNEAYREKVNERGGFWLFDKTFPEDNATNAQNDYFGMHLSFDFYKPSDGLDNNGEPMIFEFSGDDDVWVYLTEIDSNGNPVGNPQCVLDIGGIHGRMEGSINFASGEIKYRNPAESGDKTLRSDVIYQIEGSGDEYTTNWSGHAPNTEKQYRLDLYYMERGSYASNCMMRFNLSIIPTQGVRIQKALEGDYDLETANGTTYNFNVVYSNDLEALNKYRTEGEGSSEVTSKDFTLLGPSNDTFEGLPEDVYFYIEEEKDSETSSVFWSVNTNFASDTERPTVTTEYTDSAQREAEGTTYVASPIYRMPSGDKVGFLFTCTNRYGEMQGAQIAKRAWKNWNANGQYDLTLEVTGSEMQSTSTSETVTPIDLVIVVDKSASMKEQIQMQDGTQKSIIQGVKDAIYSVAERLAIGSNLSIVAFSGDDLELEYTWNGSSHYVNPERGNYDTYNTVFQNKDERYYRGVTNWYAVTDEESKANLSSQLEQDFENNLYESDNNWQNDITGGTHAAGGLLGAQIMLSSEEIADSTNPKVVIFMTDGSPTVALNEQGRLVGDGTNSTENIKAVCRQRLNVLKASTQDLKIFAVDYRTTGRDWLDPEYHYGGVNNTAIDKYYNPSSLEELLNDMNSILSEATSTTKLSDVIVEDQLSEYVAVGEITVGDSTVVAPDLYVKLGTVAETDSSEETTDIPAAIDKTPSDTLQHLEAFGYTDGIVSYRVEDDTTNTVVAEYNTETKTITWYVGRSAGNTDNSLGNETKTLIYEVTALPSTDAMVTADDGTGTHSNEFGYHSNDHAKVSYNDGTGTKTDEFKHPVVIPDNGTLKITKEFSGLDNSDEQYHFSIEFNTTVVNGPEELESSKVIEGNTTTYSFELGDRDSYEFTNLPAGTIYEITESGNTTVTVNGAEYALTDVSVEGAVSDDSQDSPILPFTANGTIGTGENEVTVTNTFEPYGSIVLRKVVEGTGRPENGSFEFIVNGASYSNGSYTLSAENNYTVEIPIHPDYINDNVTIQETGKAEAWKTTYSVDKPEGTTDVSETEGDTAIAAAGDTVTFKNYYYQHILQIEKSVNEPEEGISTDEKYSFTVDLVVEDGKTLSSGEVGISTTPESAIQMPDITKKDVSGNIYTFTIQLVKSQQIRLELPQKVLGYTVTETVTKDAVDDYNLSIEDIDVLDAKGEASEPVISDDKLTGTVTGGFADKEDHTVEITYTNKYVKDTAEIIIEKTIDETDSRNQTFIFEIVDSDGTTYYSAVEIPAGETRNQVTIKLPVGSYTITEEDSSVRYELQSVQIDGEEQSNGTVTINVGENAKVSFHNVKTSNGYFTDTSSKTNVLGGNGLFSNGGNPEGVGQSVLSKVGAFLLPDNKNKQETSDGEDMPQPI